MSAWQSWREILSRLSYDSLFESYTSAVRTEVVLDAQRHARGIKPERQTPPEYKIPKGAPVAKALSEPGKPAVPDNLGPPTGLHMNHPAGIK